MKFGWIALFLLLVMAGCAPAASQNTEAVSTQVPSRVPAATATTEVAPTQTMRANETIRPAATPTATPTTPTGQLQVLDWYCNKHGGEAGGHVRNVSDTSLSVMAETIWVTAEGKAITSSRNLVGQGPLRADTTVFFATGIDSTGLSLSANGTPKILDMAGVHCFVTFFDWYANPPNGRPYKGVIYPSSLPNSFAKGLHQVGVDIAPGEYVSAGGAGGGCSYINEEWDTSTQTWQRIEHSFRGNSGPIQVALNRQGAYFESSGCGRWTWP